MNRITKILCVLILAAALPLSLLLVGHAQPSYYQEAYYAELADMYDRLYETEGKKIVIVGGSNVAFGVNGELLEDTLARMGFHYTVCPFGLYAAVGTSAMLDLSADALGEGDVVILAVEPGSQTMSTYFGATAFWKCAEDKPEMLLKMSGSKLSALVGNYVPYLQERMSIAMEGNAPVAEGVYAAASFNARCDMIYPREGNIMPVGYDTGTPIDLSRLVIEEAFVQQVNEYCAAAREKGAVVVMSFSPMNRSAMRDNSEKTLRAFFRLCNERFDCPVISNPNNYVLQSGWFYDTNFHMNDAGADLRTYLLAEDLLAYLGCYEKLEYEMPVMPGTRVEQPVQTEDTGDFLFEAVTGEAGTAIAYRVSGITEQGQGKTSLTVPEAYEGLPVVGFAEDALVHAALEELRLPESIESLPDEAFKNCPVLVKLVLSHGKNPCTVTEHTFDGADQVRIHVPEAAYALYRDGAGCDTNPWEAYLDRIETY